MPMKLGELAVQAKLVTSEQLEEALVYQRQFGGRLGQILINLGFATDEQIAEMVARKYDVPVIDLPGLPIDRSVLKLIPAETAQAYQLFPVSASGATLTVAMADPTNVFAIDDLRFMTGYNIEPVVASGAAVMESIDKYYGSAHSRQVNEVIREVAEDIDLEKLERSSDEAPVVKLCNLILVDALRRGASEIHIEPFEHEVRVRFRIDGVLYLVMEPPLKLREPLANRFKIMSKLETSERRLPQDGVIRIRMRSDGKSREASYRISTLPTRHGESIVLKVVDTGEPVPDLADLGFEAESRQRFEKAILKTGGLLLVTGPTGSGRTTTLYSALNRLNTPETKIVTIEDTIEVELPGVIQLRARPFIGLDFSAALSAALGHQADVVMIEELRDIQVAQVAAKGASGHLVLSSLPVYDATSAFMRLMNMGVEPHLVATSVSAVCAQRLVRRVCRECRREAKSPPKKALVDLGFTAEDAQNLSVYKGEGCVACNNTGYRGRIGLFEVIETSGELRQLILEGASSMDLREQATREGMITLRTSGLKKIADGLTTIEEVLGQTVK